MNLFLEVEARCSSWGRVSDEECDDVCWAYLQSVKCLMVK